jgi:hypothetical protein
MSQGKRTRREQLLSGSTKALPVGGRPASAVDALLAGFRCLDLAQQDEFFVLIRDARLEQLAGEENEIGYYLRSLKRAQDHAEEELSPARYKAAWRTFREQGDEIHEFGQVVRFFGTWRAAKEALALSEETTSAKIEARFRARLIGKVHHYSEKTLREVLERCAADLGKVPLVIEYKLWRQREEEIAKATGEEVFLPSDSPYRRRWGSWEAALEALGFPTDEIKMRLEPGRARSTEGARKPRQRAYASA